VPAGKGYVIVPWRVFKDFGFLRLNKSMRFEIVRNREKIVWKLCLSFLMLFSFLDHFVNEEIFDFRVTVAGGSR